jgi:hypothetical protein
MIAMVFLAAAAFVCVSGCSVCGVDFVSSKVSPGGRVKAVVYTMDCGATVRTLTEISVLPAGAGVPEGRANALVVRDDPDSPIERSSQDIDVHMEWLSDRRLLVLTPKGALVDRIATSVGGVAIEYGTY